jgi:hypothetical protein
VRHRSSASAPDAGLKSSCATSLAVKEARQTEAALLRRLQITLALESLLDGQAHALTQKAIDLALDGDLIALRICLDRILPVRKNRPIEFALPAIETIADAPKAIGAITAAVASGEISVTDAADVSRLVETYVRAIEASDLDKRLRALEEATRCERGR